MTTPVGSVTSDVNSILNPTSNTRKVTADISGGDIKSTVDSTGDEKIFEGATKQLGKQDFLQLLVTQMRFQDPLAPQDNQQFISQLAQFSALEGTSNINKSIEDLGTKIEGMVSGQANSSNAISNSSATGLIGKNVRVNASDVVYDPKTNGSIDINVHTDAGTASVVSLLDSEGNIVNAISLPTAGDNKITWDGSTLKGEKAAAGKYTLKVTSKDGTKETGYTYFQDKVTGITYSKSGTRLEIKGQAVAMDQVVHVGEEDQTADK